VPNLHRPSLSLGLSAKLKFPIGQVAATSGSLAALQESGEEATPYLRRHNGGDWGELDEHDRRENQLSLQHGFRLLDPAIAHGWWHGLRMPSTNIPGADRWHLLSGWQSEFSGMFTIQTTLS
jgi:hypothetical protein